MNNLNAETIQRYFQELANRGESIAVIERKIRSVDKFIRWAYQKNIISSSFYQQSKEEIDKILSSKLKIKSQKLKSYLKNLSHLPQEALKKLKAKIKTLRSKKTSFTDYQSPISSFGIHHYIGFLLLLLFMAVLGAGLYNRFFQKKEQAFAYPQNLTRAGRLLSFQGRLTDSLGNPIVTATNVRFRLYNVAAGGSALYDTGACSITPDQDGIFNVLIGGSGYSPTPPQQTCGSEIPNSIFTENANVYLGVTVGADAEMEPRQQIANVGYAINAETLQGFPPGTGTSNIPFINQDGDLLIAVANPGIRSTYTSADFTISSARAAVIQSAGSGDVVLQATESGTIKLRTGGLTDANTRLFIGNTGNIGIGTTTPSLNVKLEVLGNIYANSGQIRLGNFASAPTSIGAGSLYYNTIDNKVYYYNGFSWTDIGGGSSLWSDAGTYIYPNNYTSFVITNNGNVGVGTTAPLQKLHVVGSCVAAETLLPIRRKKKKNHIRSQGEEDDDFEWEYFLERIDHILPGDEVLSLNEQTGEFQYAKVNQVKDMGIQEVYELKTKSGKIIRTTGEHPYLTLIN